jgi:hypothetical protein
MLADIAPTDASPPLSPGTGAILGAGEAVKFDVAFSPGGRTFASAGRRGAALWHVLWSDFDQLERRVCKPVIGNLTRAEWRDVVPGLSYRTPCLTRCLSRTGFDGDRFSWFARSLLRV